MTDLLDLAERAWRGELDLQFEHHPVHTHYAGATELAPGLLALKGIAGMYAVDCAADDDGGDDGGDDGDDGDDGGGDDADDDGGGGGGGLVLLDTGSVLDTARLHQAVRTWRPDAPLRAAVYSHHHVDHVMGVAPFDAEAAERGWARPTVYAHELLPGHFDRYLATLGFNTAINRRQFAIDAPHFRWPSSYRYPDVVFERRLGFRVGKLSFHLEHARGETDDVAWTWIPERRWLHTGDLFIWAVPNAGNPQKVQRFVSDWAGALERMATLGAEILLPGHGLPILGRERIVQALADTALLLREIEGRTLAAMNRGWPLDRVLREIDLAASLPSELLERPYLRPIYDDPAFLVRMVWRRYAGWWDGEYDTLLPAPRPELAAEWVALAGGAEQVLARVDELLGEGRWALACHLVESAHHAAPEDAAVHAKRAEVYRAASEAQPSSMGRNILRHAALASERGRRDLASDQE
ncbi:MAG TPA: alkyl sulfatase dimerization domain-containing protein [Thermoanaerobaculia bacterium]|nr:alkyl sulfatase dimerization domain-containing protein [Thermoanaerobaculia bacterium]